MRLHHAAKVCLLTVVVGTAPASDRTQTAAAATDTAPVQWNGALLQAVGNTRFAPMLTARALAITHTCMYDAWAAYDPVAEGVYWSTSLRQPAGERTLANKSEAVSFAAHTALIDLFPSQAPIFDALLGSLGYGTPGVPGTI